jgi:hypothetical protein
MRYVSLALIVVLGAAAALIPAPSGLTPSEPPSLRAPAVAVCAVEEGSGRTTQVPVLSTVDGEGELTVFAGGDAIGSADYRTGPTGATTIDVVSVAAVGTAGALVETPIVSTAVGSVMFGSHSFSAEACASTPERVALVAGGSTSGGHEFVVQLMNPFAREAVVDLVVQSDAGQESNERFTSMIIPARDSVIVDFTALIPGREAISVRIEAVEGRVLAVGRQVIDDGVAIWRAVAPAQGWFLPVPALEKDRKVIIANSSDVDVEYQVDLYGPEELEEAYVSGVLPAHGQVESPLTPAGEGTLGIRVISTGPVVASLWMETESGVAVTTGIVDPATRWLLPGAGAPEEGRAVLVVMNPGLEDVAVTVRPLRPKSTVTRYEVGADGLLEIELGPATGYLVESEGPTLVMWMATRLGAGAAAVGVPIQGG